MQKYFFSSLLLLLSLTGIGQELKPDSTVKFKPTGIRFGADLIQPIKAMTDESYSGYEFVADVDIYRYFLVVEYGGWSRQEDIVNGSYENDGSYFRTGIDVNFIKDDPDRNVFFLGVRYGLSRFDENLVYTATDPDYGDLVFSKFNDDLTGSWIEITSGLKVRIWKGLFLGFTARFKFAHSVKGNGEFIPFDIPGYGLASENSYWGFNYQAFWRLPFRK